MNKVVSLQIMFDRNREGEGNKRGRANVLEFLRLRMEGVDVWSVRCAFGLRCLLCSKLVKLGGNKRCGRTVRSQEFGSAEENEIMRLWN